MKEMFSSRLRPGMVVVLGGDPARVLRVNGCSAAVEVRQRRRVEIGARAFTAVRKEIVRISPNAELVVLKWPKPRAAGKGAA